MTAVLQSRGLGKRYRQLQALTDCTLSIPAGHIVGLVGPNGAGKTTLLNLAAGMLSADIGHDRGAGRQAGQRPGAAGQGRLRRAGHPHLRRAVRRRPPAARRPSQPRLGRRPGPRPDRAAGPGSRPSGPGSCPAASAPSSP